MESLDAQFVAFSKFGDSKSDGKLITLTQIDKWMKQAGAFDSKFTTTDTAIEFGKLKSKLIDFKTFVQLLENICKVKGMKEDVLKQKLQTCGAPGTSFATKPVNVGGVDRLTDTSKYTGTHKERFDESGKGKGKEGRVDEADDSGYVGNYKGANTYDTTHK